MKKFIELVEQNNFKQAIKQLPLNYDRNPININYISQVYMELQEYDQALKIVYSIPQQNDLILLYRIGNIYEKQQQKPQAEKYYQLCINKKANTSLDFFCQGEAFLYLEQFEKSLQQYTIALEIDSQNIYALNSMGEYFYKHENKYPKAIECFNNAIMINKTYYKAIYNKGKNNIKQGFTLLKQQQYQEAIICFDRLDEISPEQIDGPLAKCQGLHKLQKYEEAKNIVEKLLQIRPRNPKALRLYAQNFYYQQNYKVALEIINQAISIDPTYIDLYNDRGNCYKFLIQYDDAIQDYDVVIKSAPNKPNSLYNKGLCLLIQQNSNAAIPLIEKAIKLDPGNPLYHIQLAKAYNQINKNDKALQQLQQTQESISKNLSKYSLSHRNIEFISSQISILQPVFQNQKEIEEVIEDVNPQIRQRYSMIQNKQSLIILEQPKNQQEEEEQLKNMNQYQKELEKFKEQIMGQFLKQQQEINKMKSDVKQGKQEIQIIKSDVKEIQNVFQDQIQIKKQFQLFEQDKDGQKYLQFYKGFYWTLSNYINIYFQLGSGLIQINYNKLIETKLEQIEQTAISLSQFGQSLTDGIPFIGTALTVIEKGLQYLLNNQLSTKFEERKTAITEIIQTKCNTKDELETVIAKASIKVTTFRKQELLNINQSLKQKDVNLINYLNKYLGSFQQDQKQKEFQQHFLYGINEAIQVLAYFYKNYKMICDSLETLDKIIMQVYEADQLVTKEESNKKRKSQSRCNQQ
ncbi:hypothetical protein pb186bvf_003094 [Paramecium bursaria]